MLLLDALADPCPPCAAAVLRAIAQRDAESFVTVLSGLDADQRLERACRVWRRCSARCRRRSGLPRLRAMLDDPDQRVIPAVLGSLARLKAPDAATVMLARLTADDPVVRAAAARGLGELKSTDSATGARRRPIVMVSVTRRISRGRRRSPRWPS